MFLHLVTPKGQKSYNSVLSVELNQLIVALFLNHEAAENQFLEFMESQGSREATSTLGNLQRIVNQLLDCMWFFRTIETAEKAQNYVQLNRDNIRVKGASEPTQR